MTCGYWEDSIEKGQIRIFHSSTSNLTFITKKEWWNDNARGQSIHATDLDGDGNLEIITGGWMTESGRTYGEIRLWRHNTSTASIQWLATKQWRDFSWGMSNNTDAKVNSIFAMDIDFDDIVEVVSGGQIKDSSTVWYGQLRIWYDP